VRQHHSADILFLESISLLIWFNPFIYLIKKEIKAIHEFLADEYAISDSNKYAYAELLVMHSIRNKQLHILNPFFHNQIKRRIAMITQFKNSKTSYLSRLMTLPILFILFCAFAVKVNHKKTTYIAENTITVVIDAGHGGIDAGTKSATGINEKDIALKISKKIQELAKNYNVHVVMTRDKDELPGNAADIKDGLKYRTEIAIKSKAELFVSIHLNGDINDPAKSGFQFYIADNNANITQKNVQLGSILSEEIKKDYEVTDVLTRINKGVAVLTHSAIPAIIVECGYLTNSKDLSFISDEQNQEKIAKDILEGIMRFNQTSGSYTKEDISQPTADSIPSGLETLNAADIKEMHVNKDKKLVTVIFKNGDSSVFNNVESKATTTQKPIFRKVEVEADFPGGQQGWIKYLNKNLHYPDEAVNSEIQGDVLIEFIVDEEGSVSDVKAISGPKQLRAESIRIVTESGKWIPAMQNGMKVKCYKRQPIKYRLEPASKAK